VVTITATKTGGLTAVISGLFLGGAGAPPATPAPGPELQGDWVGRLGSRGYALAAWNNSSDRLRIPQVSLSIQQGTRYRWSSNTSSLRALENEVESQRRAAAWYHSTELRLRLTFSAAYSGDLHIYAIDWDSQNRRERITVNDGSTTSTVDLSGSFVDGAWVHVPINVPAGGVVTITATKTGGLTAVISGLFLGGAGAPPP
jgi:YD repeat-containing protein